MKETERWAEQLLAIEEEIGGIYERLSELKQELRDAGRKKDVGALDEALQKLGRQGQLFGEMRLAWSSND